LHHHSPAQADCPPEPEQLFAAGCSNRLWGYGQKGYANKECQVKIFLTLSTFVALFIMGSIYITTTGKLKAFQKKVAILQIKH